MPNKETINKALLELIDNIETSALTCDYTPSPEVCRKIRCFGERYGNITGRFMGRQSPPVVARPRRRGGVKWTLLRIAAEFEATAIMAGHRHYPGRLTWVLADDTDAPTPTPPPPAPTTPTGPPKPPGITRLRWGYMLYRPGWEPILRVVKKKKRIA